MTAGVRKPDLRQEGPKHTVAPIMKATDSHLSFFLANSKACYYINSTYILSSYSPPHIALLALLLGP